MTKEQQGLQTVIDATGCDRWIARKALDFSNGCISTAVDLVKERASYKSSVCHCGEVLAGKWDYCPYCGEKKDKGHGN